MNKSYLFYKPNYILTKDQKDNILHNINVTNFARMKLILIAFTIIELLFILFNDIPYLTNLSSNAIWNDSRFFVLHLLTLFVSIIGFGLIKVLTKYKECKYENICKLVISILTILLLSLIAIINGVD